MATNLQETSLTLEQRMQDKIVELQKVTLKTLAQVDKSFQTSKEEMAASLFSQLSAKLSQTLHNTLERSLNKALTASLTQKMDAVVQQQLQLRFAEVVPQIQNKVHQRVLALENFARQEEDRSRSSASQLGEVEVALRTQQAVLQALQADSKAQHKFSKQLAKQHKGSTESLQASTKQIRSDQGALLKMITGIHHPTVRTLLHTRPPL